MISFDQVKPKLLTVEQAREKLSVTEPLAQHTVELEGSKAPKFILNPGWNVGLKNKSGTSVVDAYVKAGSSTYTLTKDAALEATSAIGLTKVFVEKTPATLIEPLLNYWYSNRGGELKILANTAATALAFTKGNLVPFSNLGLLDAAVESITAGSAGVSGVSEEDIYVDYKWQHDLRLTRMRLIVPDTNQAIGGDTWSTGVQIQNSIVGEKPTSINGYLFTWECTNGQISTHASSGNWNRRTGGQGQEIYEWARHAVDEILGGLSHEFEALKDVAEQTLDAPLNDVLADVFQTYKVPVDARKAIIERLVNKQAEMDDEALTMYDILFAITSVANDPDVPESIRNILMQIGGDLPGAHSQRCNACHRLPLDA